MPRKKTKKSPSRRPGPVNSGPSKRRFPFFLFARIGIVAICISCVWLLWLDHRIKNEFEGKRWLLPARVYASPLELFPGQHLSIKDLEQQLKMTGYRPVNSLQSSGDYKRRGSSIDFIKRPFDFWDGNSLSRQIRVNFSGERLSSIYDTTENSALGVIRLEPQLIGKIYPHHNEDRVLVPYSEVPPFLVTALIAVEDRHFFSHSGVDYLGILRAVLANIRHGGIRQGGSTLTQQLVKNFFLTRERTYWRKFNEMLMSFLLENRYNKADILSAYINEVYLGQQGSRSIHGFGTAAEYYFGRPLQELDKHQLALLVGMVKGASYYNPFKHPERARKRRDLVLKILGDLKYEKATDMKKAASAPLGLANKPSWSRAKYPAFLDVVRQQLLKDYRLEDLRNEGLRIFTSLQPQIQDQLEAAIHQELPLLERAKKHPPGALQTAMVVIQPGSGEILGLVGGRDRDNVSFNRAVDAKRPIGSLIKPLIYYLALSKPRKYNILTRIDDSPVSLTQDNGEPWQPRNYDRQSHGKVSLLTALTRSYNQSTVRLGLEVGIDQLIKLLSRIGVDREVKPYPSLLLGALDVSPLTVAQVYQAFANGGFQIPAHGIREVLDSRGVPLHRYPLEMNQVLEPSTVFLVNFLLSEVINSGTGKALQGRISRQLPMAGKTGTTNDTRDSWFAGFGDDLLAVAWIGRDDNKPTGLTGATGAMRVWAVFMKNMKTSKLQLIEPEGIRWMPVSSTECSGLKSIPYVAPYPPKSSSC